MKPNEILIGTLFARHLVSRRNAAGKSKYQMIKESGLDRALYYRVESGERSPTPDVLERIAPVLGVTAGDLRRDTFDDMLGPADFTLMRDWLVAEHQDRQRRLDPLFWTTGTNQSEYELQMSRLFKGLGYEVKSFVHRGCGGLLLNKPGEAVFVLTDPREVESATALVEILERMTTASSAGEGWAFRLSSAVAKAKKAARGLPVRIRPIEDLAELQGQVPPLFDDLALVRLAQKD